SCQKCGKHRFQLLRSLPRMRKGHYPGSSYSRPHCLREGAFGKGYSAFSLSMKGVSATDLPARIDKRHQKSPLPTSRQKTTPATIVMSAPRCAPNPSFSLEWPKWIDAHP